MELETEVHVRRTPVRMAPCLKEKPLRGCQQQQNLKLEADSVPLLLLFSLLAILPSHFLDVQ